MFGGKIMRKTGLFLFLFILMVGCGNDTSIKSTCEIQSKGIKIEIESDENVVERLTTTTTYDYSKNLSVVDEAAKRKELNQRKEEYEKLLGYTFSYTFDKQILTVKSQIDLKKADLDTYENIVVPTSVIKVKDKQKYVAFDAFIEYLKSLEYKCK